MTQTTPSGVDWFGGARFDAALPLNTGPLPDGSIDRQDVETLREVGKRLRVADNAYGSMEGTS